MQVEMPDSSLGSEVSDKW